MAWQLNRLFYLVPRQLTKRRLVGFSEVLHLLSERGELKHGTADVLFIPVNAVAFFLNSHGEGLDVGTTLDLITRLEMFQGEGLFVLVALVTEPKPTLMLYLVAAHMRSLMTLGM